MSSISNLLKNLIRSAPTLENGEFSAATIVSEYFSAHQIDAHVDRWGDNHANVIASIGPNDANAPTLLFGSHLDVVPANKEHWQTDPFEPVEKDEKIFGRGAVDMLGGLCAAVEAIVECKDQLSNSRVIFAATAGEETDSCGVIRFAEQYRSQIKNPVGVILTEPTGMELLRAHRGMLWLKVQTAGKTAHGSMPQLGINAVLKMNALLDRLRAWQIPHTPHPLLGGCSVSPNRISGGSATNIVPDSCILEIDIRTIPGQKQSEIIGSLQAVCDDIHDQDSDFKADISIIRSVDALETPADHPFVEKVCRATGIEKTAAAGFTTDGPHFAELCDTILIIGPGDGTLCHKPDEYIEIAAVQECIKLYKQVIQKALDQD